MKSAMREIKERDLRILHDNEIKGKKKIKFFLLISFLCGKPEKKWQRGSLWSLIQAA